MKNIFSSLKLIFVRFLSLSVQAKIVVIVIVVSLLGSGIYLRVVTGKSAGYITQPVKRATITEIVSDSGEIMSVGSADVYSPTTGFIKELFVVNNQPIKEKDKLFTVKSSATLQEQQTAHSAYLAAVSALKTAESTDHTLRASMYTQWKTYYDMATSDRYEKSKGVPDNTNRTAAEFHTNQENWLAAERKVIDQATAVSAAKAAVDAALTAYRATQTTTVTAATDGFVKNISVSVGTSVSVLSLLTPSATPVLKIASGTVPEAVILVGQSNIAKIKIGQKVIIHPDPYKDKDFTGTVARIDELGQNTAGVVTYKAYVAISDPGDLLKPGMTTDNDIITNERKDVLAVPNSAVVLFKGGKAVRIRKGNSVEYLPVKVGIKGESMTEIMEGLSEGQEIILALTNEKAKRPNLLGL